MNLNELGAYKHKVASIFANDPDIIDVLLGPVDENADTDEMLLGDDPDSCGHILSTSTLMTRTKRQIHTCVWRLWWQKRPQQLHTGCTCTYLRIATKKLCRAINERGRLAPEWIYWPPTWISC